MEKDSLIAHGTSAFLRERLFQMSDPYQVVVCKLCGNIASDKAICKVCEEESLVKCDIPFAAKLLFSELMAMNIKIQILPKMK
jgi:DNA-directed RNA polymerase II subunit RPB2